MDAFLVVMGLFMLTILIVGLVYIVTSIVMAVYNTVKKQKEIISILKLLGAYEAYHGLYINRVDRDCIPDINLILNRLVTVETYGTKIQKAIKRQAARIKKLEHKRKSK